MAVTPQVWEIWSLKCLPPPSNLTTEVKETFFIILVTQQSKYFPEFLGYFARFEKYFIIVRFFWFLKCCFKSFFFPPSFLFVLFWLRGKTLKLVTSQLLCLLNKLTN